MSHLKTFPKGGVHPPDRKKFTRDISIQNAAIPTILTVPLQQHIGSPAECVVEPGEEVREGTLIGRKSGFVSASVHSPVPGIVKEIKNVYLPSGLQTSAVCIEIKGEFDRLGKRQEIYDWEDLSVPVLLETLADQGIVGLGGATFPAHVKYSVPKGSEVELFVVNGVECEPYLCADHRLMLERTREIFEGIKILRKLLSPKDIVIAVEENKPDAVEIMSQYAANCGFNISVETLAVKYPQGDEKQVIKALTDLEVPSGGLPIDIGAVVSNVGTVFAIYEAIILKKPVMDRTLTIAGGAIKNPGNFKVKIGTPIGHLLEECGGFNKTPEKISVKP